MMSKLPYGVLGHPVPELAISQSAEGGFGALSKPNTTSSSELQRNVRKTGRVGYVALQDKEANVNNREDRLGLPGQGISWRGSLLTLGLRGRRTRYRGCLAREPRQGTPKLPPERRAQRQRPRHPRQPA